MSSTVLLIFGGLLVLLVVLAVIDIVQRKHAIRRNFPLVGRLRYMLEKIGPELRQYIVTGNDEERPFSRDQRRWVYASAKSENQYFGFGSDNKMDLPEYLLIRHSAFPYEPPKSATETHQAGLHPIPSAKVLGEWRRRDRAFRPESVVNISAMSFGSLSSRAIEALNRGAAAAGCLHNTGEGGISNHHRHGADLIYQIGTGYFGCRDAKGNFDLSLMESVVEQDPVAAIEIKLSQGAKPGLGGVLPGVKVTPEIAAARRVRVGQTVYSPAQHKEFHDISSMIDFIERLADATGVPVGIKSAVGQTAFWSELADEMKRRSAGPDFITIDGGEGGTGAAPLVFADHVALPFRQGFAEVQQIFAQRSMQERLTWIGSGKLGFPGEALLAMALGADMIAVGREAMLSIGCIQAQICHTDHCPTGVATQSKWLMRGLDPTDKALRAANYLVALRAELLKLAHATGYAHPGEVPGDAIDIMLAGSRVVGLAEQYGYEKSRGARSAQPRNRLREDTRRLSG